MLSPADLVPFVDNDPSFGSRRWTSFFIALVIVFLAPEDQSLHPQIINVAEVIYWSRICVTEDVPQAMLIPLGGYTTEVGPSI